MGDYSTTYYTVKNVIDNGMDSKKVRASLDTFLKGKRITEAEKSELLEYLKERDGEPGAGNK